METTTPDLARLWKSHIDKLASRSGSAKDLISVLSARGSQHSYAKASTDVRLLCGARALSSSAASRLPAPMLATGRPRRA